MANTLAPSRNIENKKISLLLGEMKRRKINCESKLKKIEKSQNFIFTPTHT